MSKKEKSITLWIGVSLSGLLLVVFAISKHCNLNYLYLPKPWFFVSSFPILLALFFAGYISKFSVSGFNFEASNKNVTAFTVPSTQAIMSTSDSTNKNSLSSLKNLTVDERRNARILNFDEAVANDYKEEAIIKYLDTLINIEYFKILRDGRPNQYLSIDALRYEYELNSSQRYPYIKRFLKALKNSEISNKFKRFTSELEVHESVDLSTALSEMYSKKVEFAAVVSTSNKTIGIIKTSEIERQIGKSFIAWKNS